MPSFTREPLPDAVRTNGATPNPWWSNAVVYQIYPRLKVVIVGSLFMSILPVAHSLKKW